MHINSVGFKNREKRIWGPTLYCRGKYPLFDSTMLNIVRRWCLARLSVTPSLDISGVENSYYQTVMDST